MLELLYIARLDYLARDSARRETEAPRSAVQPRGDDFLAQFERASAARRKARKSHAIANGRTPFDPH
ncbi:hypothetical protein [Methylocystis heyeri]|uniref:Uncharacterized protein n=1 Tax=Methylocystis heyeri TaxID=391905 RepID=A0A6B8KFZ9_9HYPH|nr:hypothetical protein [Methylocystis heyeri]QGM45423.1 hypothetical protein H2LOC_006770 [Methylocystis heyeri]